MQEATQPTGETSQAQRRILFVDDEEQVLDGLRDMLRRKRRLWDMEFAQGPEAALVLLNEGPFDVVVSDMRMNGMNGAELLQQVKDDHPGTIRIMLTGDVAAKTGHEALGAAQQFLSKPCTSETLQHVIERGCKLSELLNDQKLRRTVGAMGALPTLPRTYTALSEALKSDRTNASDIAQLIEQDVGMTAKVLQLVNSAFFAIRRRITSVQQAIVVLGAETIRTITLTSEVFGQTKKLPGISLDELQDHSLLVAKIARELTEDQDKKDEAFTAGMLHDVGILAIASCDPERLLAHMKIAKETGQSLHAVEKASGKTTHAEIGAYLLGLWGLPHQVVEAVAHHHEPTRVPAAGLDLVAAVHLADQLAHEFTEDGAVMESLIDEDYVCALGKETEVQGWRDMTRELVLQPEPA